jgi:putative transposase
MSAEDVKSVLDMAIERTGVTQVVVYLRPKLLSDNGSCFISSSLRDYLKEKKMMHTRGKPYHPQTQGKIERYHRSMKNLILLDNYYSPEELIDQISQWVAYYNNHRYHEAIENVTPADKYYGRDKKILYLREMAKRRTMQLRRKINMA